MGWRDVCEVGRKWRVKIVNAGWLCLAIGCGSGNQVTLAWELNYFGSVMTCVEIDIEEIEIRVTRQSPIEETLLVVDCLDLSTTFSVDEGSYLFDIRAIDVDEFGGVINRDAEGTTLLGPMEVMGDIDLGLVAIDIVEFPPF